MNLVSFVIVAILIVLVVLAVRYTRKHGTCESCGGNCAACHHCDGSSQTGKNR